MAVYFIRAKETNLVKIGYSVDVKKRFESLQTASPLELELLAVINNAGRSVESRLHGEYTSRRVRGEWFNMPNYLIIEAFNKYSKSQQIKGIYTAGDLLQAIGKEPDLTDFGFGIWERKLSRSAITEQFKANRKSLSKNVDQFKLCCEWLAQCNEIATYNHTSYGLKHRVEQYFDKYVTNGAFIAAIIHLDYKYIIDGPNAWLGISERSIKELARNARRKQCQI